MRIGFADLAKGAALRAAMAALAVTVVALISLGAFASPAKAEAFTVTNTNDSGAGSLREAVNQSIGNGRGTDNITFDLPEGPNTITLASELPYLVSSDDIVIDGGAADITVSGNGQSRLFALESGVLTLRNLTLTEGFVDTTAEVVGRGGAIYNGGTLTVEGCTFSGNKAGTFGGAIHNTNTLIVVDSAFSGNSAGGYLGLGSGGAISTRGGLHVEGSTFSGNSAVQNGGAIENYRGRVTVVDSTLSNNSAHYIGGGIRNDVGTLKVDGSTFSNNSTKSFGGGIHSNGTLTVDDSTFSGNSANRYGGGLFNQGTLKVEGSTFSGNSAGAYGGGLYSNTDAVTDTDPSPQKRATIGNSTLSDNSAASAGGGIYADVGLTVVENTTITKNTAPAGWGSGVSSYGRSYTRTEVSSSIISANTNSDVDLIDGYEGAPNTFQSNGHNLIGGGNATGAFGKVGDQTGVDNPGLEDLADNGGPTKTHALLSASPAIDAGDPAFGPTPEFDQRGEGFPRIQNARVDIGAFEAGDTVPPRLELPANITKTATSSSGTKVSYQQPTATDVVDGDVPVECSPASGSTFPLGTTTVSCSATDRAGNRAEGTFEVTVAYSWSGVLEPIKTDGSSVFKLRAPVPVKFQLTGESAGITDASARLYVAKVSGSVVGTEVAASSTTATSGNLFRYDPESDQYAFNWDTKGLEAGTYQLRIDLGDGTKNTVRVSLR